MTHSPLISGPVLCLCLRLDGGEPFCIVIYVELFSHRALRRRPVVNSQRYTWEMVSESRVRRGRFFSFGGKALRRMDEGEIPDNGNIYKSFHYLHHSLENWRKMGFSWSAFHSCVASRSTLLPVCSAQARVVSARVEK